MDKVQKSGKALLKAKPEISELVSPKIEDLRKFDILEKDTHEKSERLFDANRAALYNQS